MRKDLKDIDLYKFEKLSKALDEWGFPKIDFESGFEVVKGVDFERAYKANNIRFEEDGIYLDYNGYSIKGYMFIQEPYLEKYHMRLPKFHVVKCKVISDFLDKGQFKERYHFSNSEKNDLTDILSKKVYPDQELTLCGYCKKIITQDIQTTKDFYDLLGDFERPKDLEVDIFGYPKGWDQLSYAYRQKHDFTCQECGFKPKSALDRRFIHTHHIDGSKTNNAEHNLKCLCIKCHSNQDEKHMQNFGSGSRALDLKEFERKYHI
ncbi:HNH endonuclease [Nitritalea halalkaliphila LW7]|uniref:HNH endonuclease n=1 Tax=Nitritalea halalkaliphila LW7 TaxID=1189621 RepID=I5BSN1_9BACT|nr:HNH endonuclease signature motif containing protein [Nitritalea halalkaliphila]EIM72583.1 HNH endonuclease [Nitritalea halalkaliphila LW7]